MQKAYIKTKIQIQDFHQKLKIHKLQFKLMFQFYLFMKSLNS